MTCPVCQRADCPTSDTMGCAYEDEIRCLRLGYEREKARANDEEERAEMFQRDARRSDAAIVAEKARAETAEADAAIAWSEVHDHEAVIRNFEASVDKLETAIAAEKARADAAEANALAVAQERLEERAQRDRDWDVLKTALAAARRECDLLRAAIDRAVSAFMSGGVCDFCRNNKEKGYHEEDCDLGALIAEAAVAANVARFNTALAAPAAGEEGKHG